MQTPPWYVLTGGPSAGKTTLIAELASRGHQTVNEAARAYIEEQVAAGKTYAEVRADEAAFQKALVDRKREIERNLSRSETIFFDRGIPDSAAYYELIGLPIDEILRDALLKCAYRKVFLLELIPFEKDAVRKESPEDAARLNILLRKSYENLGFPVIDVPVLPIEKRVDFVFDNI
jgi:predicted ATPase